MVRVILLIHRPCNFVPTDVLWQGGFPFEPKQSVGATVVDATYVVNGIKNEVDHKPIRRMLNNVMELAKKGA